MSSGNPTDLARKEGSLIAAIQKMLPDFAKACRASDIPVVIMHQDAFAADYQEEEYRLIGMAVKFAGICGKEVRVHGRNRIGWALRADWLSFTNLGHSLKSHKIEQPNSVARADTTEFTGSTSGSRWRSIL